QNRYINEKKHHECDAKCLSALFGFSLRAYLYGLKINWIHDPAGTGLVNPRVRHSHLYQTIRDGMFERLDRDEIARILGIVVTLGPAKYAPPQNQVPAVRVCLRLRFQAFPQLVDVLAVGNGYTIELY